jgi:CYTH domain-containing protein
MQSCGQKSAARLRVFKVGVEIERKFIVVGQPWQAYEGTYYRQGYLTTDPERTVRVRIAGKKAFLTIKGASSVQGAVRTEFEYPLPLADAEQLLEQLCPQPQIEKTRYCIEHAGHTWEVDVFEGENAGLVIAEVEIASVDEVVELPGWVGPEVTGEERYYNAYLTQQPYTDWVEK